MTAWPIALVLLTVLRLVVAGATDLSPDEAYYWVWSKALAGGYLDHPPMVAVFIRIGTAIAGDTPLGVRLLAPLATAVGSLLLVRATADLFPGAPRAGVIAAVLLNATLTLGAGSVTMTPDTPLLLFWTAALAAVARVVRTGRGEWWLVAGVCAGLALDSKYTASLMAPSLLVWLIATPSLRRWLWRWPIYAAAAVAAAAFSPVLIWNARHGFVSFAKQGGRTGVFDIAQAGRFLAEFAGGQIGLVTPVIATLCILGLWRAARVPGNWSVASGLLLSLTLVPLAVFVQHAFGDRVQANWPAIMLPSAAIAAGVYAPRFWRFAAALGLALGACLYLQATAAPIALPRRFDIALIRLGGWSDFARQVDEARRRIGATFVAGAPYGVASELATLLPSEAEIVDPDARWASFSLQTRPIGGRTGLLVLTARRSEPPDPARWDAVEPVGEITRARGGVTAETFHLYRVTGRGAATVLPRPLSTAADRAERP